MAGLGIRTKIRQMIQILVTNFAKQRKYPSQPDFKHFCSHNAKMIKSIIPFVRGTSRPLAFYTHVQSHCLKCSKRIYPLPYSLSRRRLSSCTPRWNIAQPEQRPFKDEDAIIEDKEPDTGSAEGQEQRAEEDAISTTKSSTKRENRLARKQRRMESGVFNKRGSRAARKRKEIKNSDEVSQTPSPADDLESDVRMEDASTVGVKDGSRDNQLSLHLHEATDVDETSSREWSASKTFQSSISEPSDGQQSRPEIESEDEQWKLRKRLIRNRLQGSTWSPTKRLSPETVEGIRAVVETYSDRITLGALSKHFGVSYEAMRRIAKSKSWRPTAEETEDRQQRWERRGERIWTKLADQGVKPPKQWRMKGVGEKVSSWKQDDWWAKNVNGLSGKDDEEIIENS
jgi:hypothetical protein